MIRQRLIRDEAPLLDNAILVRLLFDGYEDGSAFERAQLIADATGELHRVRLLRPVDVGWRLWVALYRAADLRDKGLGIVPSGAAPHYDASVGDVYGQDFGSAQITASSAEELIDRFTTATYPGRQNEHFTARPSCGGARVTIQIDIDADLMLVDDEDRYIGHLPADPSRLQVGGIAIAGRPGGYTWALVEEITDTAVFFRAIEADEARKHGRLELAAS